jgi:hypothetical protein
MKMRQLLLCCLIFPPLIFGAASERNWKTGKVTADSTINSPSGTAAPHPGANDPHILIIQGDDYIYTVEEKHAWNSWCLLIQGEEIKYALNNHSIDVVDADGYKCRLNILKQEKRPSP